MKKKRHRKRLNPDTVILLKQIALGVAVTSATALLFYSVWYGTRHPAVTIDTVTVSGGKTIKHQVIEELVWQELEGDYLRLVPHRFSYLYPRRAILQALADIPRIKNITIDRVGRKELQVTFTEYQAVYLWCTKSGEKCYFTDEDTFAFAEAPNLRGGSFLRFTTLGYEPEIGQTVLTQSQRDELFIFLDGLKQRDWVIRSVDVDAEVDAYVELTAGGEIKLSLKEDAAETLSRLEAVLATEEYQTLVPGEFQYIDLRFGNKVFVNRTEEIVATTTEEPADTVYEATVDNIGPIPEPLDIPVTHPSTTDMGNNSESVTSSTAATQE